MREILFRGKNIGNGEWVEGSLVTRRYNDTGEVFETFIVVDAYPQTGVMNFGTTPVLISPSDGLCYRVDKDTICQYTGLTDKNGNKIWENDILSIAKKVDELSDGIYEPPLKYPANVFVRWDLCGWIWETIEKRKHYLHFPNAWCHYEAEVIGNVFDNKELLEET